MVTLKVTNEYANKAVDSFFKNTILNSDDKFVMVDNDGDFKSNWNNGRINEDNFILNDKIESFSYNMNILMRLAIKENKDLVFLSNDVIFTPNWSELLVTDDMTLSIPSCNQTHNLGITSSLSMDEFGDRYDILNQISLGVNNEMKYFQSMLMPFYVLRIPLNIYSFFFDMSILCGRRVLTAIQYFSKVDSVETASIAQRSLQGSSPLVRTFILHTFLERRRLLTTKCFFNGWFHVYSIALGDIFGDQLGLLDLYNSTVA